MCFAHIWIYIICLSSLFIHTNNYIIGIPHFVLCILYSARHLAVWAKCPETNPHQSRVAIGQRVIRCAEIFVPTGEPFGANISVFFDSCPRSILRSFVIGPRIISDQPHPSNGNIGRMYRPILALTRCENRYFLFSLLYVLFLPVQGPFLR